jgi:copper resistance protein D
MIWQIHQFVLGIHIFLAMIWVGGILFVGWGVFPAIKALAIREQRNFLFRLMKHTHIFFTLAGAGVIFTGILLGTWLGPIKSLADVFNTTYGNLWLSALCIGILTLLWGVFIGYKQTMRMLNNDTIWKMAENGHKTPLSHAMFATAAVESVEVVGFIILLSIMMLL